MSERFNQQLLKLTLLLQLERRARQSPAKELPYVIVNETAELIPFRQAVLWNKADGTIETASGVAKPEHNSPYALWLKALFKQLAKNEKAGAIWPVSAEDLPNELAKDWPEWLPEYALWVPLLTAASTL